MTWLTPTGINEIAKEQKEKSLATETVMARRFVKVYPDATRKVMFVEAKETRGSKIDFFVFDLEGTLMKHFKMKTGDREKISGLEKGKYVYSVFSGDEEADHGEFDIH